MADFTNQEQKLKALYGNKMPKKKTLLGKAVSERKFFDSGDYALAKAGKTHGHSVGTTVPSPENIPVPHSSPTMTPQTYPQAASPVSTPVPLMSLASQSDKLASSPVKESRLGMEMGVDGPSSSGGVSLAEQGSLGPN